MLTASVRLKLDCQGHRMAHQRIVVLHPADTIEKAISI